MDEDSTMSFNIDTTNNSDLYSVIKDVYNILKERGYNPTDQIVGYLISGDIGYISSYKGARNKISELDRSEIIKSMFKEYIK